MPLRRESSQKLGNVSVRFSGFAAMEQFASALKRITMPVSRDPVESEFASLLGIWG